MPLLNCFRKSWNYCLQTNLAKQLGHSWNTSAKYPPFLLRRFWQRGWGEIVSCYLFQFFRCSHSFDRGPEFQGIVEGRSLREPYQ